MKRDIIANIPKNAIIIDHFLNGCSLSEEISNLTSDREPGFSGVYAVEK